MKKFLILIMLLCGINAMAQENAASLPELQEWYSIKGGVSGIISYLPGFDSVGGGLNAITHRRRNSDPVFYNRFPFDTASQFQWKVNGAYAVVQIDFNNDGIHDYLDTKGRIYTGTKKGEKPNPEPVRVLSRGIVDKPFIHDFNNDSYPDVLLWNIGADFEIVFGNKELANIKRTIKRGPRSAFYFLGGYTNEEDKPRIILYDNEDYREGFYLYGIRTASKGDSVEIFLDELDKIEIQKLNKDEPQRYIPIISAIYQEKENSIPFVNISKKDEDNPNLSRRYGYLVQNDTFMPSRNNAPGSGPTGVLKGSVDGDSIPDVFDMGILKINGNNTIVYKCFSGHPLFTDSNGKMYFIFNTKCSGYGDIQYIGDVNGDGIGDIAFGCIGDYFSIYLGLDWRKVSVNEVAEYNSFKLHQNIPNPVQKDRKTLLPVSLKQGGNYVITLYSLQGSKIKDLFNGELSEGEHKIPLDLMGLSAGMYIVKMNNGSISRERAIMIGE
ncbi:MAG: T9SS type A sorting domain-containing protein [Candidatus Kapabacteria bacterium]|nr:T9SS type A sorting domain-containing protein [Candidatus Kapabacteria bacterium]